MRTNSDSAPSQRALIAPLKNAGFALHWLHKKSKRPVGDGWSDAPVASFDDLLKTYQDGYNLGVRLGMPSSLTDGSYLHVLDIDIRVPELADEAWEAVETLFADLNIRSFPTVISGSGGASRHIYFATSKPFYSRKLAVSEGKHRSADGTWHYDWEVELFGTGKQVAMPPSIHPDTGKPYIWEREFDFDMLAMGVGPSIAAERLEKIATAQSETYEYETREPLTFKAGQLEAELDELDDSHIDDYHDWVTIGAALSHQYGGSNEGYELWVKLSKRSTKFNEKEMPAKWRSFGRNRRAPVTMATVRQWVLDERHQRIMSQFDDVDAFDEPLAGEPDPLDDILGEPAKPAAARDPIDDLLGTPAAPDQIDDLDDLDNIIDGAVANQSDEPHWTSLLDFNEEGALRPNLHNVTLLVQNDPRLAGVLAYNEFTQETVQRGLPKTKSAHRKNATKPTLQLEGHIWEVKDPTNGDLWTDVQDSEIRRVFEAPRTQGGYGVKIPDRDMRAAVNSVSRKNSFHPIREYLNGLKWDGKPRLDTLFIDYLGCDDYPYYREAARIMMVAAATRAFEPGHKYDVAIILEGGQGIRKSSFIKVLGRKWFAELQTDFGNSQKLVEAMSGKWILELAELSSFFKTEIRQLKNVMSTSTDRARLAYDHRPKDFPRGSIFVGSTNDRQYLADESGGRRFLPVQCKVVSINTGALERQIDQIWAEAVQVYRSMRVEQPVGDLPLYLRDPESQRLAKELQESRRLESDTDTLVGQIAAWLDKPINDGGFDDVDASGARKFRNTVCSVEVWCECLNGDRKNFTRSEQQKIGAALRRLSGWEIMSDDKRPVHPKYGSQRTYYRLPNSSETM